jgi:hypothetical protein
MCSVAARIAVEFRTGPFTELCSRNATPVRFRTARAERRI